MDYIPTIGLEIHAELKTASKMFCSCMNDPDEEKPNANICPICLGHPGTLPVLNHEAIKHVLTVGVAVSGKLADFTEWDRKQYFYPDIPKGYQISQYKFPLVSDGELSGVALERIHLEEDTAQSTHDIEVGPRHGSPRGPTSLVNFNRAGVPLMELVTKPVIHDAATAVRFAKELQLLLRYLGAGEANMEKGEMRVEANISVAPVISPHPLGDRVSPFVSSNRKVGRSLSAKLDSAESPAGATDGVLGTKTEVKNLNSFRSVERAIEYEVKRQIALIEKGEKVIQETRGWDDAKNETYSQRSKESSHDYRYFPDPDIPKMKISEIPEFSATALSKSLPELPWVKRERFKKDFGMTDKEAEVFVVATLPLADYYEAVINPYRNDAKKVKLTTNYITNDYLYGIYFNEEKAPINRLDEEFNVDRISVSSFSEMINLIADGILSSRGAKDLIGIALKENAGPKDSFKGSFKSLAEKRGLLQKSDASDIEPIIEKVIADNTKVVAEYKAGKAASIQFLIGQAMKAAKGAANPTVIRELLVKKLA